jgi:rhodanese-related sulfurtransferase
MFDTLQKLKALPDETIVYPAHDYNGRRSSTISKEKATNPFMQETNKERFVENASSKTLPKPFNIENIIRVNQKGEAKVLEMISPKEAQEIMAKDPKFKLLDVRSALEYSEAHINGSINIPIDVLFSKIDSLGQDDQGYIVFCRTGNRSPMAADILVQAGMRSVKVMSGGVERWKKEKLPIIKGVGGVSLERQIRLIAGSLMLLGVILGCLVSWKFIFISAFVACGLIFAGITDSCLMGMLLMKLPYNKKMYKAKLGGGTCSISQ